ncbi:MAG: ComF family protein [Fibrobacterota bacterium]
MENCFSAYVFDENLKKIMHSLKYQKLSSIGFEIGVVSAEEAGKDYFFPYDCIVPVPVHHTRLRERGYNQVLFIAEGLNSVSGKPVISVLARIRKTGSQTRLSKEERALNIRGAFAIRKKFRDYIKNKKILLIDDVYTTGATSDEARRILIENGSELVTVFTVCRA